MIWKLLAGLGSLARSRKPAKANRKGAENFTGIVQPCIALTLLSLTQSVKAMPCFVRKNNSTCFLLLQLGHR